MMTDRKIWWRLLRLLRKEQTKLSLSVENKSLPPKTNIMSIKTQTFDDFSFREQVIRIKLNFPPHLRDVLF
jgi:hypothetical protein